MSRYVQAKKYIEKERIIALTDSEPFEGDLLCRYLDGNVECFAYIDAGEISRMIFHG